ncbi:MAG: uracil-DNA glycosylase [Deltaproteobacteria bacterium]|nr:MAG: uracil-DNA glycosylase [Deltaproteobacteria bacterium]
MRQLQPKPPWSRADYWSRPVPGFGDTRARICLVGLAPGAHGANRSGRPFTGDGAGDFMYPLLHRAGFASRPDAVSRDDGLVLKDLYITNAVKCLPPGNKPVAREFASCRPWLEQELTRLARLRVIVALGGDAFRSLLQLYRAAGHIARLADHPFGHGVVYRFDQAPTLVGSYHTSRYNIQTGRLTEAMFLELLEQVRRLL